MLYIEIIKAELLNTLGYTRLNIINFYMNNCTYIYIFYVPFNSSFDDTVVQEYYIHVAKPIYLYEKSIESGVECLSV